MEGTYRLNLILHGMLGIVKPPNSSGWDIYVPIPDNDAHHHPEKSGDDKTCDDMPPHVARWGIPEGDDPTLKGLEPINNENFVLAFNNPHPANPPIDFDPAEALVLQGLIPQPAAIWSRISIPPPTIVRKYRGIETSAGMNQDPNTRPHLLGQPRVFYEVAVFSYLCISGKIFLIGDCGSVKEIIRHKGSANFGIYYQSLTEPKTQHGTEPFNNMFRVEMSGGGTAAIDVGSLTDNAPSSMIDADGPPSVLSTATRLQSNYLLSLSELQLLKTHLDPTSCGHVVVQL